MSHYGNLGALAFRILAVIAFFIGISGLLYWIPTVSRLAETAPRYADAYARAGSSVFYTFGGIVLFFLGRPLGRLVSWGLEMKDIEPGVGR
ncbi:MAG: hypothetical protein K9N51_13125 [Candidatus Pacebacteria bacterium]|nr:hypothetical protein [Candidatus Paceibacterota bacterium]